MEKTKSLSFVLLLYQEFTNGAWLKTHGKVKRHRGHGCLYEKISDSVLSLLKDPPPEVTLLSPRSPCGPESWWTHLWLSGRREMELVWAWLGLRGLLLFSLSDVSDSLQPRGLQQARVPSPSPSPGGCSNSCPLSLCHPTISSSVAPFSSCLQSFPASGSFSVSGLFTSADQRTEASASVLPMNIQGWRGWSSPNAMYLLKRKLRAALASFVLSVLQAPAQICRVLRGLPDHPVERVLFVSLWYISAGLARELGVETDYPSALSTASWFHIPDLPRHAKPGFGQLCSEARSPPWPFFFW